MRVLLVSTYELGHQPLHVAAPAAALRRAGHEVRALDLSVDDWDADAFEWADKVAFSVPMHTAMRLAMAAARRLARRKPLCFYGLYAHLADGSGLAERMIGGEYTDGLVAWARGARAEPGVVDIGGH